MATQNNQNTSNIYSKLWKEVEKAESKGLPQTAANLLKELEELTIQQCDTLEQYYVSERLLENLQKYNWKEANSYRSSYYNLQREIFGNLDYYIEKYEGNPRVIMLHYERLVRIKRDLDSRAYYVSATGEDYKNLRKSCMDVLAKYKDKVYTPSIKGIVQQMDRSYLSSSSVGQIYPQEVTYTLNSKNVAKVKIDLYRLKDNHLFVNQCTGILSKVKSHSTLISSTVFDSFKNEYNISEGNKVKVNYPKEGNYVLVMSYDGETSYQSVQVSNVATGVRTRDGKTEIYAANLLTGEPYKDRVVDIYKSKSIYSSNGIASLKPVSSADYSQEGFEEIEKKGMNEKDYAKYCFRVSSGSDIYAPFLNFSSSHSYGVSSDPNEGYMSSKYELFTDRALYKPGDVISFKVIAYKCNSKRGEVIADKKMEIMLKAPNSNDVIDSLSITTNDFGSASGSFTLPEDCKNGVYNIYDKYRLLKSVRVETYKRPTFDITLNKNEEVYTFGDVLKQSGQVKSYAGYSVANALIQYEITASPITRYGQYIWFNNYDVVRGKVTSDNEGKFSINFLAERPKVRENSKEKDAQVSALYTITVRVTDPQGETHESRRHLAVSDIPVVIEFALGEKQSHENRPLIDKDATKQFTITLHNHDDVPYDSNGTYEILQEEKCVMKGKFHHDKPIAVDLSGLASGEYILKATTQFRGQDIVKERKMILFSPNDKVAPVQEEYFYYPIVEKGGIEFLIGTNEDDLYLEMELLDGNNRLHRESLHLQKEMRRITLPYKESYNSSVNLFLFGFRNGHYISHDYRFTNPIEVTIPLVIDTFRDNTSPNSEETMTIQTAQGAEVLLSIFDITSDRLGRNSFYFKPLQDVFYTWVPYVGTTLSSNGVYYADEMKLTEGSRPVMRSMSAPVTSNAAMADGAPMAMTDSAPMAMESVAVDEEVAMDAGAEEEQVDFSDVEIRSNKSELVAFYPHLTSDNDGKIEVKYKTNDQIGTYRVLLMGYNKQLQTGQTEGQLLVSKPVMVAPNMPLFVREGDKIVLKSKVVNLTEKQLKGTARIEFFNPDTKEKITLKGCKDIPVTLLAGAQGEVQWTITAPKGSQLGVTIMLKSAAGSDAEQNVITIEPKEITLTEAASFIVGQEKGKDHKYYENELRKRIGAKNPIIEYAEYSSLSAAKEALSIAKKPESDNAINWISALYMNQMRALILEQDGQKEDTVAAEAFRNEAFAKLKTLQDSDGGIMWFNGMNSSNMLTLFFLEKIYQLVESKAIALNVVETEMVKKALNYIDGEIAYSYKQKGERGFSMVQYFSVRTLWAADYKLSNGAESALKKFISQTKDGWQNISIQDKADLAQVFMHLKGSSYYKKDYDKRIDELVTSLRDYAVINPTIGCYFPNAVMPFRGLMHTEIYAHAQLLDLFNKLGDRKMVRDLAQWLLLQKHNQAWQDCVATTDAVYAILSSGVTDLKFGAVYYTYTTEMKKVKEAANEITVKRSITRASDGSVVENGDKLRVGDEILVQYLIHNTENRSFVMMEAMRPACFYQKEERSGYSWDGYYREVKKSHTNYYFELLPEEYTTIQERFFVEQEGTFSSAIVKIESLYATEYRGHTDAIEVHAK